MLNLKKESFTAENILTAWNECYLKNIIIHLNCSVAKYKKEQ